MTWTAKDISFNGDNSDGIIGATITFTDGKKEVTVQDRVSDPSSIKKIITDNLNEFSRKESLASILSNPPTVSKIMEVPAVEPVETYEGARLKLIASKQDLDLGLINQKTYDTLLAAVINLKP